MGKVKVKCTYIIEVEIPEDDPRYDMYFDIEENHCPGTGRVGLALQKHMKQCEKERICWACALGGTNEILVEKEKRHEENT